jgi:spore maturation protein CgeB
MKVLVIGSDKVYAIENFYVTYLRENGVDVKLFTAQTTFYDYYQRSIINKIIFKAGFSGILNTINKQFKQAVLEFKPEIVWVFKGMEIYPNSLCWAKEKGIRLVNYNPDNPFIFTGKGSGNQNVTDSIDLFDLHFTYNLAIQEELKRRFNAKTAVLPFGFELEETVLKESEKQVEIIKTCFLGNPDKERASFIMKLAEEGVKIDVYGNDWNKFLNHPNISVFNPVYGDELWKVLRRYRIQLNLMRVHNESSHNMRTFEVPGIGGILLAPDTKEHRLFFTNGNEIFLYSDIKECVRLINEIIAFDKEKADHIRFQARKRSLDSGYTYKDRTRLVIQHLRQLHA